MWWGRAGVWSLLLLAAALTGCGYRMVAPGSQLTGGLARVGVPLFGNTTAEAGAEVIFTSALKEHLLHAGRLGGPGDEGQVLGVINAVSFSTPMASAGRLPNYRLSATVTLTLKKGEQTLNAVAVSGTEDYPSGADLLLSEANRGAALTRLAETLMRDGLDRLSMGL